jgi:hypothetical protein
MSIITPERAGQIRGELTEKYGATWMHHYHEAIEAEILIAQAASAKKGSWEAVLGHLGTPDEVGNEWIAKTDALQSIYDLAHNKSTGPAVPDTLWEIRNIAQEAL